MSTMPTTRPSQLHRLLATLALPLALAVTAGAAPAQTSKGNLEGTKARCIMNAKQFPNNWKPCRIGPLKGVKDGFFIRFDGTYDAYWGNFRPAPGSQPTTDRRPMVDDQGTRYLMSGHHSFTLEEVGGYGNVIEVAVP